jgi:hypothetical protein
MAAPRQDVILKLNTIGELFNAPDVNPFSANEIDVLGEAALPHAVRRMLARRIRHWHEARLVIQLPPVRLRPICRPDAAACAATARQDRRQSPHHSPVARAQRHRVGHGHDHFRRSCGGLALIQDDSLRCQIRFGVVVAPASASLSG